MKLLLLSLSLLSFSALAEIKNEDVVKFVPGGTVVHSKKDEVKVQTAKGSIVELEFKRNGSLDEASGDMIEQDVFIPGEGNLELEKIVSNLKSEGYQLKGDWSYDKSWIKGWHYEVDAILNKEHLELTIDARSGKIVSSELDD